MREIYFILISNILVYYIMAFSIKKKDYYVYRLIMYIYIAPLLLIVFNLFVFIFTQNSDVEKLTLFLVSIIFIFIIIATIIDIIIVEKRKYKFNIYKVLIENEIYSFFSTKNIKIEFISMNGVISNRDREVNICLYTKEVNRVSNLRNDLEEAIKESVSNIEELKINLEINE